METTLVIAILAFLNAVQGNNVKIVPYNDCNNEGSESGSGSGGDILVEPCSTMSMYSVYHSVSQSVSPTESTMSMGRLYSIIASSLQMTPALTITSFGNSKITTQTSITPVVSVLPTPTFSERFTIQDSVITSSMTSFVVTTIISDLTSSEPISTNVLTTSPTLSSISYYPTTTTFSISLPQTILPENTFTGISLPTQTNETVTISSSVLPGLTTVLDAVTTPSQLHLTTVLDAGTTPSQFHLTTVFDAATTSLSSPPPTTVYTGSLSFVSSTQAFPITPSTALASPQQSPSITTQYQLTQPPTPHNETTLSPYGISSTTPYEATSTIYNVTPTKTSATLLPPYETTTLLPNITTNPLSHQVTSTLHDGTSILQETVQTPHGTPLTTLQSIEEAIRTTSHLSTIILLPTNQLTETLITTINTHGESTMDTLMVFTTQPATETSTLKLQSFGTSQILPDSSNIGTPTTPNTYVPRSTDLLTVLSTPPITLKLTTIVKSPLPSDKSVPGSTSLSLYTAVGASIGACICIAVVVIVLVLIVAGIYKRHHFRHTFYTAGASRWSTTDRIGPGMLSLSLSEVDVGPLTSQQSRVSLASVTPTPASNIDKTIFDDTLNLAYKTSTFTRPKEVTASSNPHKGHAVNLMANHSVNYSVSSRDSVSSEDGLNNKNNTQPTLVSSLNPPSNGSLEQPPPTSGDQILVKEVEMGPVCLNTDNSTSTEENAQKVTHSLSKTGSENDDATKKGLCSDNVTKNPAVDECTNTCTDDASSSVNDTALADTQDSLPPESESQSEQQAKPPEAEPHSNEETLPCDKSNIDSTFV